MDGSKAGENIKPGIAESSPVAIAPDGDVIFVVGDEQRRLRVHSVFLRTVSSVFRAMLGPHFREGANLSSDCPTVIPLPDDDPEAMEVIFNIVHFRLDAVKERYEPGELLCLAVATDKYDMTGALRLSTRGWLRCEGIRDPDQLWKLAKATYILRNYGVFRTVTMLLVVYHTGSFYRLNDDAEITFDFEDRLAAMLEERRGRLRLEMVYHYSASRMSHSLQEKVNPARISTTSLNRTIEDLFVEETSAFHPSPYTTKQAKNVVGVQMEDFMTKGLGGLCLTCVRTGEDHENHYNAGWQDVSDITSS